ncbi:MAG: S24 family peptidase [Bacteroidales bacterium]|nr:hypothetical protein [Bacteroidales bacterium]MDD6772404.1 S24 family peptidase [Bacteroidales bacterium]
MEEKIKGKGGRRPGAGRPKGDSRIYSFRVGGKLAERIDSEPNKTEFFVRSIERALEGGGEREALTLPFFETSVVAGFPVPLDNDERSQDIDIIRLLCPHPEASYLVRVNGNSMIDAGVLNGDIVIVDKSRRDPGPKEIAVCELNGEYTLKHFVIEEGQGWLVPANPEFPRIRISSEDDFRVWGTVTYIIHKARD